MADPLRELLAFQEKVNRLFDNALTRSELARAPAALGRWIPPTRILEPADTVVLQAELPGVLDLSGETQSTLNAYGIGEKKPSDNFGRQCLLARRMIEAGVRHVEVCDESHGLRVDCASEDAESCEFIDPLLRAEILARSDREVVENTDGLAALAEQGLDEVGADESAASGDKPVHGNVINSRRELV